MNRSYVVGGVLAAVAVAGLVAATSPGRSGSAAPAPAATAEPVVAGAASATVGALRITDAYVPQPASDDVAAAYLTVTDTGAAGDALTHVTSDVSSDVGLHDESTAGGAGTMVTLTSMAVPAHGALTLVPDHRHLMIMGPSRPLVAGQHVRLTLTFATAGTVSFEVPVVPFSATLG